MFISERRDTDINLWTMTSSNEYEGILIQNGIVVNDDEMFNADLLIKGNKIVTVDRGCNISSKPSLRIIDARGRFILPGGIDPHTHFQLNFMGQISVDDFYHGTKAALSGGTTMIIDFAIPTKDKTPFEAYEQWREWADPKVTCDYGLSMAITSWNQQVAEQMSVLIKPEYGINSFKFFLAYENVFMVTDKEFYQGLKHCAQLRALARVHAENGSVIAEKQAELLEEGVRGPEGHRKSRPEELEAEATNRACVIAEQAKCPLYVVHVMSKGAARAIAHHRQKGQIIFGEPISAGLAVDGSHYYSKDFDHAAGFVLSPPLSTDPTTPVTLMKLLASGQLHLTGTDNCTFTCAQKRSGHNDFTKIPNGVNGVEDRMSVIWEKGVCSGIIDPMRFVAITSTEAAKIFNIYPTKGRIQVGSDADIVIWNPKGTRVISAKEHHHAGDFNIFEGMSVRGIAEITISRGRIVWENGELNVKAGSGKFIPLLPDCDYVYSSLRSYT